MCVCVRACVIKDGMASAELELMLREAGPGQEVTFQVQYNPTGKRMNQHVHC